MRNFGPASLTPVVGSVYNKVSGCSKRIADRITTADKPFNFSQDEK